MRREFALHPVGKQDLVDAWLLVYRNDGEERADRVTARIEAFIRSLLEFPFIGRLRDDRRPGLRICSVPGLHTATVVFLVADERVSVLRIGYLGRNVVDYIPEESEKP
ncbi:type II toxin-antitoxin system RelE/ParE family toxin [Filomicrobium sp.]|uniref:type II toxin-antitoxin system RelE/ParE family toxin n=1 Tax=Filomicrobium sp. TaxID=2024831 RepID=UPI002589D6C7|nr:type II toxin-antitoxin system RelE/ParE family toxin [Filomicrobium sp.]MCV0371849.1 type II toxin-antitoxin system RelE/ParE family toxin [Filomicrobium sp.]